MPEYRSLDARLKSEGWEVKRLFLTTDDLPKKLAETALDLAQGKYLEICLIPGDIARQGEDWLLTIPGHLLYVKKTEQERARKQGVAMIFAHCHYHDQGPDSAEFKPIS